MLNYNFKDFQDKKRLSSTKNADVLLATYEGQKVVIKIPNKEYTARDEVNVLNQLTHPNIVRLLAKLNNHRYSMVIEYMEEGDLDHYLKNNSFTGSALQQAQIREKILIDVLEGLVYLHEQDFVHRDIKCANIFLSMASGVLSAKIGDFGAAKKVDPETKLYRSKLKTPVGTQGFMAPENTECTYSDGFQRYTAQGDVFSMGIVLLMLGRDKYVSAGYGEPSVTPEVTLQTKETFLLCYEKDPSKRITSQALRQRYSMRGSS